jgi:hypothetical protein
MSVNVSPYLGKGTGEAVVVWVCEAGTVGCGVAVGVVFSEEHDKRENVKAIVNRNTLGFNFKESLISLLLTDGVS